MSNLINPSDLLEMTGDDLTGVVLKAQQINQLPHKYLLVLFSSLEQAVSVTGIPIGQKDQKAKCLAHTVCSTALCCYCSRYEGPPLTLRR